MTFDEFVKKAREVHGDKYEYVAWDGEVSTHSKVKIVCKEHGEFGQFLRDHLGGHGCNRCGGSYCMTDEEFKEKMYEIYGDSLDFSETKYANSKTKVKVICPIHGEFYSTPASLLNGTGCIICNFMEGKNKYSNTFWKFCPTEQKTKWIKEKLKQIHNNKYSYDLINEINSAWDRITIICPEHGEFTKVLLKHLNGEGCPKCSFEESRSKRRASNLKRLKQYLDCPIRWRFDEEFCRSKNCVRYQQCLENYNTKNSNFKNEVREILGDDIDFSKTRYYDRGVKVVATCIKHGDFEIRPDSLRNGIGCPICRFLNNIRSLPFWKLPPEIITKYVIEKFKIIHGNKYSYDLVTEIISEHDYIDIKCNRCGNVFRQQVHQHIAGNGCPYCKQNKFEENVELRLIKENISYEKYKKFDWLKRQNFDFYLPEYKIAVECQGSQHFRSVKIFGGDEGLKDTIERDIRKYNLSKSNGQKLLYLLYPRYKCDVYYVNGFQEIYTEENTFKTIDELLHKIREAD